MKNIVSAVDKNAFVTISDVSDIMGSSMKGQLSEILDAKSK